MRQGFRQSMAWLHSWAGLLLGWLLYAIFLTGTSSYFQEETTRWMTPEVSMQPIAPAAGIDAALGWLRGHAPDASDWSIYLPGKRAAAIQLYWTNGPAAPADARTAAKVDGHGQEIAARDTQGGWFLYRFHYDLHYVDVMSARYVVGIAAMMMLVALLTGIVTHRKIFADFFLLRLGKGQRSWLDAHNAAGVLFLPFVLMISYTGLVTLATTYMPWGIAANYADQGRFYDAAFPYPSPPARAGAADRQAPIAPMLARASAAWGGQAIGSVRVLNPGDSTARVIVGSGIEDVVGVRTSTLTFDGVSGRLLDSHRPAGAAAATESVMVGLHAGRYARALLRWLYFVSGLAGCAMIASGLVLWTVKRRARLPDPQRAPFGLRLVETLNIGAIVGLPIGIAVYFLSNRLLPLDLPARADREIASLFIAWGATFLWAALRPRQKAWRETLAAAAALFAAVPLIGGLTTGRHILVSLRDGDTVFLGFDLVMLAIAAGFLLAARKAGGADARPPRRRGRPRTA